ncbi:MAG: 50S ribosomal protein L3 N(5)-glutamine methyltransferase [Gammaproteobacteria bacterium]|nr:50S ribosomal protein L3 N(5)-glutamine methyltransferase [Gammaproteobacteria bacterium]
MPAAPETAVLRTVRDFVRWGASEFGRAGLFFGHGTDNALDESYHLVTWALKLPHELPAPYLDAQLTASERKTVLKLLQARVRTRRPAPYLTGEAWFAGLPFFVDERVLVPRSPAAELIEQQFQPWLAGSPQRILDLCAGSGCIGIACAVAFPDAQVDLAEVDAKALQVCRRNVERHHLGGRVEAVKTDLFAGLKGRRYGLIVSNPPYVPTQEWKELPAEFRHEPRKALDAGADGMDIVARILRDAPRHLEDGGLLVCEVGGSVPQFEARFPEIPVVWPEFERGGDGVFAISREDLLAWQSKVKHVG